MFQWDDVKVFLATARSGSTVEAAARLQVNQSTVSRRLAALEQALSTPLFERTRAGFVLSKAGRAVLPFAEEMEAGALRIAREIGAAENEAGGVVVVATIDEIATWIIAPVLPEFHRKWPHIRLDLKSSPRLVNLERGEADVALRLARPESGNLFARRVGGFAFGVYASQSYLETRSPDSLEDPHTLDWIMLEGLPPHLPESRWFAALYPDLKPILKCNGTKPQIAAVQAGLGVALLPRPTAYLAQGLVRLPVETKGLYREIWLVVHRERRHVPTVQAVVDFLQDVMTRPLR
ncbi:LysR family transcriptional regulator [Acanthopleuribacter pedis]|uniref:LysR family transcriptional regulator n=1 Tax=Acanthopleuribacter pedis TaxID=442870 RepID=A0A8J7Q3F4_9BACT|nr:LysR family transcriptional regulator [Acanthopleuribacter pedis]MBO1319837.1 LysR family transcriptional regulator [Acanthopleuribacter pedis]